MIPILYEANETSFLSNGIGRLVDCLRLEVTEERDGIFELEFDYPVNGQHYDDITEGRIIASVHDDNKDVQPFDIYGRSAPIDGVVTFYAHHVSYRLQYAILQPFTASSVSDTFDQMARKCVTPCPFTFWTDKTASGTFTVSAPVSVKEMLGGVQGSILDVYGKGEYEWDKFAVKLHLNRGTDTGVQIRYGKNLVSLTQDVDTSGFYSAVVPYWLGSDGTLVTLPEWVVQSAAATAGHVPVNAVPLDLSDRWEEAPTETQLRAAAQTRMENSQAWLPDENIKVDFVALWQTEEYANIAPLEQVRLCDRVDIIHPELGLAAKGVQVIKVVYDGLLERYISMELGTARTSFADTVKAAAEAAILPQVPTKSFLQAAIEGLSAEINAGAGGIITDIKDANGNRTEMLILCDEGVTADTPPEQCQHIWRVNKNGIGYSDDYGQTYRLAITASGQIVADFITTGTMLANIIRGGTLTLGGANNGNGVFVLLDGNGNEVGRMDNNGASLNGDITMKKYDTRSNWGVSVGVKESEIAYFTDYTGQISRFITECFTVKLVKNNVEYSSFSVVPRTNGIMKVTEYKSSSSTYYDNHWDVVIYGQYYNQTRQTNGYEYRSFKTQDNEAVYFNVDFDGLQYFYTDDIPNGNKLIWLEQNHTFFRVHAYNGYDFEVRMGGGTLNGSQIAVVSTSSRRYKHSITDKLSERNNPHKLYDLPVKQFVYNDDHPLQYADMKGQTLPGFIAEDVERVYPAAVIHNADGEVESWDERRIIPGLLALIQEQKKQIESLEARLAHLEKDGDTRK